MQLRVGVMQDANDVDVPVVFLLMMQAADNVHLGTAVVDASCPRAKNLLVAHHVAALVAEVRSKSAKRAAVDADIRGFRCVLML